MKTEDVALSLQEVCKQRFGLKVHSCEPVALGWLNLKWKLVTSQGEFLLKLYHQKRFRNVEQLTRSLYQQKRLYEAGIPAPRLFEHEGELLHSSEAGPFILMSFCEGELMHCQELNELQMLDLGTIVGSMHLILNDGTLDALDAESTPQFVPPSHEKRLSHWQLVHKQIETNHKYQLLDTIRLHQDVTKKVHIESMLLRRTGWAHRDIWLDNLLFEQDHVSAVLDFDRLNFDYLELDVARAILSCALQEGQFQTHLASAFLVGYRIKQEYERGSLVGAMQMLWYLECVWWIHAEMDELNPTTARFAEETMWLAENYDNLDSIMGHL